MKEIFISTLYSSIAVLIIRAIIGYILPKFEKLLISLINFLVKHAEKSVKGSKMGQKKKSRVIKNLRLIGVKCNQGISSIIDVTVDEMNARGDDIATDMRENIKDGIVSGVENAGTSIKNKLTNK